MSPSSDRPDLELEADVRLGATVSQEEDGPDQCTIYPLTVSSRDERRSAWITAEGDAFVDLTAIR